MQFDKHSIHKAMNNTPSYLPLIHRAIWHRRILQLFEQCRYPSDLLIPSLTQHEPHQTGTSEHTYEVQVGDSAAFLHAVVRVGG